MAELDTLLLEHLLRSREPVADVPAEQATLLRAAGSRLETHPMHGVRLLEAGLGVWVDLLETTAPRAVVYGRTASTQDVARHIFEAQGGAADGTIVAAHEQTKGRGRLGRSWLAPPGTAVTFSRVCLLGAAQTGDRVTLAASVAVARAIEPFLNRPAHIKWPNDVYVDGKKIAGILVEATRAKSTTAAILGIGVNVNMPTDALPVPTATSFAALGVRADRLLVMYEIVRALNESLAAPADDLLADWRRRSLLLHHAATFQHDNRRITGEVIDLDPLDGLIVRTDSGAIVHLPGATTTVVV